MWRTVTLLIEFKLLTRMEKIYRLYPLIHYGDFWIAISKKSIYRNFRYIDPSLIVTYGIYHGFQFPVWWKVNISESWNYEITPWKLRGDMEWSEFFDVYYTLHIYVGFRWKEITAVPDAPVMEIDLAAWQVDVCRTGGWRSLVECRMRG